MSDGSEPIADYEILYRRVPATNRKAMPFAEWQALLAEQLFLRIEGRFPQDVPS